MTRDNHGKHKRNQGQFGRRTRNLMHKRKQSIKHMSTEQAEAMAEEWAQHDIFGMDNSTVADVLARYGIQQHGDADDEGEEEEEDSGAEWYDEQEGRRILADARGTPIQEMRPPPASSQPQLASRMLDSRMLGHAAPPPASTMLGLDRTAAQQTPDQQPSSVTRWLGGLFANKTPEQRRADGGEVLEARLGFAGPNPR
mmetsp:Transcript_10436/g.24488  ORF Transcript_10436/g.24488 Transcript_10436/m.24488 type:complete len:198 (-) Transcript_10436:729-1322(-)